MPEKNPTQYIADSSVFSQNNVPRTKMDKENGRTLHIGLNMDNYGTTLSQIVREAQAWIVGRPSRLRSDARDILYMILIVRLFDT